MILKGKGKKPSFVLRARLRDPPVPGFPGSRFSRFFQVPGSRFSRFFTNPPLVPLCGLYENTSKAGKRYFVGYLGKAKVVVLAVKEPKEGEPQWTLCIQERAEKPGGGRKED